MSVLDYCRPKTRDRILRGETVPWVESHSRAAYLRRCVLSFPRWVSPRAFHSMRELVKKREKETGERHSIDHIIPLAHPRVCGLSVPENMEVIPLRRNIFKGNSWCDGQLHLFTQPEQLTFF